VRGAIGILRGAQRFILLAEVVDDKGEASLKLHTKGYAAEALVAGDMMKVAVGIMKRHKDAAEAAMAAAQATPREVEIGNHLILPPQETAPPAFGSGTPQ